MELSQEPLLTAEVGWKGEGEVWRGGRRAFEEAGNVVEKGIEEEKRSGTEGFEERNS